MRLETFFAEFDHLTDTPNAVPKMRNLLLRWAVQGKLVAQDSSDQPATMLIADAVLARRKLVAGGVLRDQTAEIGLLTRPYDDLPTGWAMAPLGVYVGVIMGQSPPSSAYNRVGEGLPFYQGKAQFGRLYPTPTDWCTEPTKVGEPGDVLISVRAPVGPTNMLTERSCIGRGLTALRGLGGDQMHLLYTLRAFEHTIAALGVGSTFRAIAKHDLDHFVIPVPPLAEQRRIVAKLGELMALCDRLESQHHERETQHRALALASLSRFAEAPSSANLDFLFHSSYSVSVADLRRTILTLAVQGRLVARDPDDEDVSTLLASNDERRRQTSDKDRRADAENQPLLSTDDRWAIPETWSWRGLADLALFVDYRGNTPQKRSSGVRLLTAKNVRKGHINLSPEEFVSEREYDAWMTRGFPKMGDVLFTTEAPMGNAAVVELSERFALAQRVICFQSYGAIDPRFLVLQILSDQFQGILDANGTGVTAKGIKAAKLKRLPIAIPPLAEQHRIVACVDVVMALIERLDAQFSVARNAGQKLMDAVVSELTAVKIPESSPT